MHRHKLHGGYMPPIILLGLGKCPLITDWLLTFSVETMGAGAPQTRSGTLLPVTQWPQYLPQVFTQDHMQFCFPQITTDICSKHHHHHHHLFAICKYRHTHIRNIVIYLD